MIRRDRYFFDSLHDEFVPSTNCTVAAAIIGAGALSAGAQAYGASKAASAQERAGNRAIDFQTQMFDTVRGLVQPFIDAGTKTLPTLQGWTDPSNESSPLNALLRLTTPGADMTAALEQTPGFQFANTYGQKAVRNSLAARGLGGPGGALGRGLVDYAEGLAGNTWQNVVGALTNTFGAGAGALQNLVSTGKDAATSLGTQGTQTGANVGSNMIGIGNAQAGAATSIGNAVGNFGNSISTAALLNKLIGGGGTGGSGGLYSMAGVPGQWNMGSYGGTPYPIAA